MSGRKVILGSMVRSHRGDLMPGSIVQRCTDCGERVYISPSSMIEDGDVLCARCFLVEWRKEPARELRTNDVQREELKSKGIDIDPTDMKHTRAVVAWELYLDQTPRSPEDMVRGKPFWCIGASVKATGAEVALALTDGHETKAMYIFRSSDEVFRGLEDIFFDGEEEPKGWIRKL